MAKKDQQMTTSDFNLEKLNTKELEEHVEASIKMGETIAIFGRRGIGKTFIAKQKIKELGFHEAYINLSVLERPDLAGYPNILSAEKNRKFVDFLMPNYLKPMIEGDKKVVALLDEADKADSSLYAPLLEFTQFHTINGTHFPNLHAIIMTGNLLSEGGSRPSPPLLDRAEKFLIEADAFAWLNWAGKTGSVHPSITAYINDNPKDLFGATDPEDRYADPSPRGWSRASDILRKGEALGMSSELLNKKVCGCIGKDAGIKYSSYYEHYQQLLPMVEDVFEGKNILAKYQPLEPTKQLITCMIICARLANHIDNISDEEISNGKIPLSMKYVGKFLQGVSYENVLVAVRSQIQVNRMIKMDLDEHPDWAPFLKKINSKVQD